MTGKQSRSLSKVDIMRKRGTISETNLLVEQQVRFMLINPVPPKAKDMFFSKSKNKHSIPMQRAPFQSYQAEGVVRYGFDIKRT